MSAKTIILIGPEGAGKSTLAELLAAHFSTEHYSVDTHRNELYAPYNYSHDLANKIYSEQGIWAFYNHWSTFEFKAVCHILQNAKSPGDEFYGKILDFGAGHSVYEDDDELRQIESLMAPYPNVILVLPCEDVDEAQRITEERRGRALELNKLFLKHRSNRALAKFVVYTKDVTPEESLRRIVDFVQKSLVE